MLKLFEEPPYCFHMTAPFYIPTDSILKLLFLHILANIYYYFLVVAILVGVRWYQSHCDFDLYFPDVQMLNFFSYVGMCRYLLWRNVYSNPLPFFN